MPIKKPHAVRGPFQMNLTFDLKESILRNAMSAFLNSICNYPRDLSLDQPLYKDLQNVLDSEFSDSYDEVHIFTQDKEFPFDLAQNVINDLLQYVSTPDDLKGVRHWLQGDDDSLPDVFFKKLFNRSKKDQTTSESMLHLIERFVVSARMRQMALEEKSKQHDDRRRSERIAQARKCLVDAGYTITPPAKAVKVKTGKKGAPQ